MVFDEVGMSNSWANSWATRWHVVSVPAPNGAANYKGWSPCINWCSKQFGRHIDDGWGYVGEGVFEFREEKHAAWFLMRWQ